MGLFDEISSAKVEKVSGRWYKGQHYAVKRKKLEEQRIKDTTKLTNPEDIIKARKEEKRRLWEERKRAYNRERGREILWKDWEETKELQLELMEEYEKLPRPLMSPRDIDYMLVNENRCYLSNYEHRVWRFCWWRTNILNMFRYWWFNIFRHSVKCPLRLAYYPNLDITYNRLLTAQEQCYNNLIPYKKEIKEQFITPLKKIIWMTYRERDINVNEWVDKIVDEMIKKFSNHIVSKWMIVSVMDMIREDTYCVWVLNLPFLTILSWDVIFTSFWQAFMVSMFWNPKLFFDNKNTLRDITNKTIRSICPVISFKYINNIPIYSIWDAKMIRVNANKVNNWYRETNLWEFDYYIVPTKYKNAYKKWYEIDYDTTREDIDDMFWYSDVSDQFVRAPKQTVKEMPYKRSKYRSYKNF